ncbi:5-oxoprolinase subunit PxpB [Chitinasiproducens palmae]|uniref:Sensor histidine kinase inhibitor, KipI family n=1 Tax=Chitinasiproducens palmae TaxID=1770053 RepID=A0A1H2PJW8_9BURK|nr:5-oxoprolinase subunit PxpB [Chitinasiproducens palmae]SDV46230.1 sensor histidine kinase inhibitor, KipI family [Chitinasiproducens palmae]
MTEPVFYPLGEAAFVCSAPPPATYACQTRMLALARSARGWDNVVDVVPGMNNVTVVFDPLAIEADIVEARMRDAWRQSASADAVQGELRRVPVHYGGDAGPDLDDVARHAGLSVTDTIALHASVEYTVFFVGFQPGFAYLGGLDARLHMARRANPRLRVPAGTVAIGGAQTGIYPAQSPGGWQLLGRTDVALFDPDADAPTFLKPGDRVRFEAVGDQPC